MKKNLNFSHYIFPFFYLIFFFLFSGSVFLSALSSNVPVITSVKAPKTVAVGIPFSVSINVVSKNKIAFLNVWFEGVSQKMSPAGNKGNLYFIKLIAKKPGKKALIIYAVDVIKFSGKSYTVNLYARGKTAGIKDSGFLNQTKPQGKLGQVKPGIYTLKESPPEFKLESRYYCTGDVVDLKGKYFTDKLKVKIGKKQVKIEKFTFKNLKFRISDDAVVDYLYVSNNVGKTKSKSKLLIRGIPEAHSINPKDAGQKDIIEIRGKYLNSVNQVKLKIKYPGINEVYFLDVIGKPENAKIKLRMPDILYYPGIASIFLNSPCGCGKKIELNIKEDGVVYLLPQLKRFYPESGAPGSTVIVYVSDLSVPKKEKVEISFNNLKGIVDELEYHGKGEYKLKVLIPDDVTNTAGYGQKVRVTAFGKTVRSKENFYLFGPPKITKVEKALWSDKFADITGSNFVQYTTFVYFSGINGEWILSEQVNNLGFNKISSKIPWGIKKGPVKIKTYIDRDSQECISNFDYEPDTE